MDKIPINYNEYKLLKEAEKQAFINTVAKQFVTAIIGLMPINGKDIFIFGKDERV